MLLRVHCCLVVGRSLFFASLVCGGRRFAFASIASWSVAGALSSRLSSLRCLLGGLRPAFESIVLRRRPEARLRALRHGRDGKIYVIRTYALEQVSVRNEEAAFEIIVLCKTEELTEPQDFALLLPPDPTHEDSRLVLGNDATEAAVELLMHVSRLARGGLPTWLHLESKRLGAARICDDVAVVKLHAPNAQPIQLSHRKGPSLAAIKEAKARLDRVMHPVTVVKPATPHTVLVAALSLRSTIRKSDDRVINKCFALLQAIGVASPRFVKLFGNGQPTDAMIQVQTDVFSCGFPNLATIDGHRRELETCFAMARTLRWEPFQLTEWQVAAYLRDQHARGKSVPSRVFHSFEWCQKSLEIDMNTTSSLVRSQRHACMEVGQGSLQLPRPAKCITVAILLGVEELTFTAPTEPLMVWAGFHAHLGHGVLRFSDAQRCSSLRLTDDAVIEQPWAMKNQKAPAPVAALRRGWSGRDWGKRWLELLAKHGLPGVDFLMLACSADFRQFTSRAAGFQDAQIALRALLQLPPINLSVESDTCM